MNVNFPSCSVSSAKAQGERRGSERSRELHDTPSSDRTPLPRGCSPARRQARLRSHSRVSYPFKLGQAGLPLYEVPVSVLNVSLRNAGVVVARSPVMSRKANAVV